MEWPEGLFPPFSRNARSVVFHNNFDLLPVALERYSDVAPIFQGVVDDVRGASFQRVTPHRKPNTRFDCDLEPVLAGTAGL